MSNECCWWFIHNFLLNSPTSRGFLFSAFYEEYVVKVNYVHFLPHQLQEWRPFSAVRLSTKMSTSLLRGSQSLWIAPKGLQSHQCRADSPWKEKEAPGWQMVGWQRGTGHCRKHVQSFSEHIQGCYTGLSSQDEVCVWSHPQQCHCSEEWVFGWNLKFLGWKIHPWGSDEDKCCLFCLSSSEGWINP